MTVICTDLFKKLGKHPAELGFIPEAGYEFEVTEYRYKILSGFNRYHKAFVVKKEEPKVEVKEAEETVAEEVVTEKSSAEEVKPKARKPRKKKENDG